MNLYQIMTARTPDIIDDLSSPGTAKYFDLSRTFAAVAVVVSHIRDLVFTDFNGGTPLVRLFYLLTGLGHQAVMVFFVVSGFWITRYIVVRLDQSRWSWKNYAIDRLSRLWIVLVPALVLGGALDVIGWKMLRLPNYLGNGAHSIVNNLNDSLSATSLAGNVAFLQNLYVPTFGTNGPLWSLCNEFWYYILFPLGLFLFTQRKNRGITLLILIAAACICAPLLPAFFCWLVGSALYFTLRRRNSSLPFRTIRSRMRPIGIFVLSALIFSLIVSKIKIFPEIVSDIAVALCTGVTFYYIIRSRLRFPTSLDGISQYGANSSFSLYVTHFPLAMLMSGVLLSGRRTNLSFYGTAIAITLLISCIFAGWLFSALTEQKTHKFKEHSNQFPQSHAHQLLISENSYDSSAR
ncbi:acyltransferase family protein [Caulobacter segnis]